MVAQLNRLKINSCILDAGAIYEWDLRNRGLNRGFGFKIFRKTHLLIYGTNLDGEHWGRCGWYGDYPGSWWQIGIKLTLMPAIIQRTCSQLQIHKYKHNNYKWTKTNTTITNAQRQTQTHTAKTFGDWSQKVDPNRHNTLYYQPQQLYYCKHLEFQLGWYETWVPCGIPHICHFFTQAKFLLNKIYTEKRQFFALNL